MVSLPDPMAIPARWWIAAGTAALVLSVITVAVIVWYHLRMLNETVTQIDGKMAEFRSDVDHLMAETSSISDVSDDLYTGLGKLLDDFGIGTLDLLSHGTEYHLPETGVTYSVSLTGKNEEQGLTKLTIRFDDAILSEEVRRAVNTDEELRAYEQDLFDRENRVSERVEPGEPSYRVRGNQVMRYTVPSLDDADIAEWVLTVLDRIDSHYARLQGQRTDFESVLAAKAGEDSDREN